MAFRPRKHPILQRPGFSPGTPRVIPQQSRVPHSCALVAHEWAFAQGANRLGRAQLELCQTTTPRTNARPIQSQDENAQPRAPTKARGWLAALYPVTSFENPMGERIGHTRKRDPEKAVAFRPRKHAILQKPSFSPGTPLVTPPGAPFFRKLHRERVGYRAKARPVDLGNSRDRVEGRSDAHRVPHVFASETWAFAQSANRFGRARR